jgi:3-phenylpropionate/trans-cinnamate dioxygenase ferredoxin reductase component
MKPEQRIVIVGGGPAALSTARSYREAGGRAHVELICAEPHLPYNRPPLTKEFLRGEREAADLALEDEAWFAKHAVTLRRGRPAVDLDRPARCVHLEGGQDVPYDACVLATGSAPERPPVEGAQDPDLHTIRTVDDALRLRAAARPGTRAVIVGAGFIACEAAASLIRRDVEVVLVAPEERPQAQRLGEQAGELITTLLREAGVEVRLGVEVQRIEPRWRVLLGGGGVLSADIVVLGTGVAPRIALAAQAGLDVEDGAVLVDASMRSSDAAVLAVGDIAAAQHARAGRRLRVEHWGDALAHGEVAGRTLAGEDAAWTTAPGFWTTIGEDTLKHSAWGDGFDEARVMAEGDGHLVVRYLRDGDDVGVLALGDDDAYEAGRRRLGEGA